LLKSKVTFSTKKKKCKLLTFTSFRFSAIDWTLFRFSNLYWTLITSVIQIQILFFFKSFYRIHYNMFVMDLHW
jgi:hypothetical protein